MEEHALQVRLQCGNYSATASVSPELRWNSGILVTWDLLSSDPVCSDPSRLPRFSQLRLHDVSLIAACDICPKCTLRLPMRYEWPLGSSINSIFIVARQPPYNRIHTDMDIRYVIVDKMPPSLRNCQIVVREDEKLDKFFTLTNAVLFFGVFMAVIICTCLARWVCAKIY
ncbi:unnamed protein product [Heligmosomoides polygyrus]|uniref:Phosphatidylinositol-glycan biosynthesis class X protein n=1 Tax=Heligmosomoides polygyrus TaxID=6339 RepID=A0A183F7V2_HELPZ|nr:unnamed protein product [Heligmosomoides polygyrus]